MKRTFYAILVIVSILVLPSCNNKEQTFAEKCHFKGAVVSFTDTIWSVNEKFGEPQKKWIEGITKVDLNENGQITTVTNYDEDGDITGKELQVWRDKYRLSERVVYGEDGNMAIKFIYSYNGDKLNQTTVHHYDENNVIEKLYYTYEGDRAAQIVGTKGGKKMKTTYSYLDDNDSYKEVEVSYDGEKSVTTFYLDDSDRVIKMLADGDTYTWQYNEKGDELKITTSPFVYTFTYKYDEKGNWIEKIKTSKYGNESPMVEYLITRHYEYK